MQKKGEQQVVVGCLRCSATSSLTPLSHLSSFPAVRGQLALHHLSTCCTGTVWMLDKGVGAKKRARKYRTTGQVKASC